MEEVEEVKLNEKCRDCELLVEALIEFLEGKKLAVDLLAYLYAFERYVPNAFSHPSTLTGHPTTNSGKPCVSDDQYRRAVDSIANKKGKSCLGETNP